MTRQELRIVFMGTPDFAVPSLSILIENGFSIVGVITSPDRPAGRGLKLKESPVKIFAKENGLNVLQPSNLKDENFISELRSLNANLQVVVAFRMLPETVWSYPALGTFNLHASLLPDYRGAAPINHAIINGETETGATTFFLKHQIDTGDIIFQEKTSILPNLTAGELHDKLMTLGAKLVLKTTKSIEEGNKNTRPQEPLIKEDLKSAPKISKDFCKINWELSAQKVHDHIRGLSPFPGAWGEFTAPKQERLFIKFFRSVLSDRNLGLAPGTIKNEGISIYVQCKDHALEIKEMQLAGKKRMSAKNLLLGFQNKLFMKSL